MGGVVWGGLSVVYDVLHVDIWFQPMPVDVEKDSVPVDRCGVSGILRPVSLEDDL